MSHESSRGRIAFWLFACCALLFCMIVIGGVTRLTRSGLSIVEWQPIAGTLPPLTEQAWDEAFAKYRETPEYRRVNHGMDLAAFKGIFWWEYFHRLLGRLIGVAFLLPLLWFTVRSRVPGPLRWRLWGIFLLGGLQGAMGWYMVKSGLVDDPRVSQYRLTAHLSIAFVIFAAMFWTALGLVRPPAPGGGELPAGVRRHATLVVALVFLMVVTGGFVAGIRAGSAYNTFPLMNGHFMPPEILMLDPWYLNFFNNMATVQFDHRLIAYALVAAVPLLWLRLRRTEATSTARIAATTLVGVLAAQVSLGIATLLQGVPVALGAAHQGGAVVVFAAALWLRHELRAGNP